MSRPTHSLRVRIAESVFNPSAAPNGDAAAARATGIKNGGDEHRERVGYVSSGDAEVSFEEQRVLDRIGEALARLGRNKRVGLTLRDKEAFVKAWKKG